MISKNSLLINSLLTFWSISNRLREIERDTIPHSLACQRVPISPQLTHNGNLLPFWGYLAG